MKKLLFTLTAAIAASLALASAGSKIVLVDPAPPEQEFASLFAISVGAHYDLPQSTDIVPKGWGAHAAVSFLATDHVSVAIEYAWTDSRGRAVDDRQTLALYGKWAPLDGTFSPYVKLGGGYQTFGDLDSWYGAPGLGLDVYVTDTIAIYTGADYIYGFDRGDEANAIRLSLGLRYEF